MNFRYKLLLGGIHKTKDNLILEVQGNNYKYEVIITSIR